jgi:hypothetical protein
VIAVRLDEFPWPFGNQPFQLASRANVPSAFDMLIQMRADRAFRGKAIVTARSGNFAAANSAVGE